MLRQLFQVVEQLIKKFLFALQVLLLCFVAFDLDNSLEFTSELFIAYLARGVRLDLICQLSPEANFGSSCLSLGQGVWFEGRLLISHNLSYVFKFIRIKSSVVFSFRFLVFIPTKPDKEFFRWFVNFSIYWKDRVSLVYWPSNVRSVFVVLFCQTAFF